MTQTEKNPEQGLRTLAYVARCASVDADTLGLQAVSIELAGAVDACDRAEKKLSQIRIQAVIERYRKVEVETV